MGITSNKKNKKIKIFSKTFKTEENNIKTNKNPYNIQIIKTENNKNNTSENLKPHKDILPNSLDTNFNTTKSNTNEIIDEDNSEEQEEDEIEDEKEDEKEEKKELAITNNIKKVFINSKLNNNIIKEESSELTTKFDYELNFFRDSNTMRSSYLSKLISSKVWNPSMKPKRLNSIIIFDWDDTLLPTTFLTDNGIYNDDIKLSPFEKDLLSQLEQTVYSILKESIEKGNVYIITNAGNNWVEYSANKFYPKIMDILYKIKIISARGEYEKTFPGDLRLWKIKAFLNVLNDVNNNLTTNIVCIGDSLLEIESGRILASRFSQAFIKTVKFRDAPKLEELLKQLKLVSKQFNTIYSSIKNLTIRIERKIEEN